MPSNFDHFDNITEFHDIVIRIKRAENYRHDDIDSAVINCRKALEILVQWIYENDDELKLPFDQTLCGLLGDDKFRAIFPNRISESMDVVRKLGNKANHETNSVTADQADFCIQYMFYILDAVGIRYFKNYTKGRFDKKLYLHPETAVPVNTPAPTVPATRLPTDPEVSEDAEETDDRPPDLELTPESINTLLGEPICRDKMTKSELEELLRYLDEGDKTLTDEQKECVNFMPNSDLLIKGTAGSGKSIVLMQRAIRLRKQAISEHRQGDVLILTYTNALVSNLSQTVGSALMNNEHIRVSTLDSAALKAYRSIWGQNNPIIDFSVSGRDKKLEYIRKAKQAIKNRFPGSRILQLPEEFLDEEFQWIKGSDIHSLEEYKRSGRSGRGSTLRFSEADYTAAFQLFNEYNRQLHNSCEMDRLDIFSELVQHSNKLPDNNKTEYILIDEAQDLQPVIIKFAKLMAKRSITIACDSAQKIYSGSFSLRNLGIEIRGRASKSLSSTFRNTKEISMLAASLYKIIKEKDSADPNGEFTDPTATSRRGEKPRFIQCDSVNLEEDNFVRLIQKCLEEEKVTIGVLYRSKNERSVIEQWLQNGSIDYQRITGRAERNIFYKPVRLCTMHSAKGLEFDIVVIPLFQKSIIPDESTLLGLDETEKETVINKERKLVYVSLTRPKERLYVTFTGDPSIFFDELNRKYFDYWNYSADGYKRVLPHSEPQNTPVTATQSENTTRDASPTQEYSEEPLRDFPNIAQGEKEKINNTTGVNPHSRPVFAPRDRTRIIGKYIQKKGTNVVGLIKKTDDSYCYTYVTNGPKMGKKVKIAWEKIYGPESEYEIIDAGR